MRARRQTQPTTIASAVGTLARRIATLEREKTASSYTTVQDEGTGLTKRAVIDFAGAGVTATDDAANSRTLVTIPGAAGGGGSDYSARAYLSADQSISSTLTWTALNLDTERFDTDTLHDTVTNPGQFTCQAAHSGKYLCWGNILWDANINGIRGFAIYSSALGAFVAIDDLRTVGGSSVRVSQSVATVINMAAGDYVEFQVRQTSGGNLLVLALTAYSAECGIMKILG